jgi:hypothetical protein
MSIAIDLDNNNIRFYKNGAQIYNLNNKLESGGRYTYSYGSYQTAGTTVNFGQKPFKFPPPDGFQPLNAANVRPETVIVRPDQFVGVKLYAGNDGTQSISGLGFSPDLVWIKNRTTASQHVLTDTVRGSDRQLFSPLTNSEQTSSTGITAFTSDGFSLGVNVNPTGSTNSSPDSYVAWCWKAGGNKNTFNVDDVGYASAAAAGLDGGTLTPTGCSVGTKQGFSIISWTGNETAGATIPHGLGKTPGFAIFKSRETALDWGTYHQSLGATERVLLNSAATAAADSNAFNNTEPTSSIITLGASDAYNDDKKMIAYVWCDVPGLQKFGKWTNNNSNDGTFTEIGFRPAILLLKDIDGGEQWYIIDSKRQTFNIPAPSNNGAAAVRTLQPSSSNSEATADNSHPNTTVDFLSNGFKIRSTNTGAGEISFGTRNYIYCAWAEAPTFNLYGAQSNAR